MYDSAGGGSGSYFFSVWQSSIVSSMSLFCVNTKSSGFSFYKYLDFPLEMNRADIIRDYKTGDSLCYAFIGKQ